MLKLTLKEEFENLRLSIEGRLVHPWTKELKDLHEEIKKKLGQRTLILDLCGTTFVDNHGIQILRQIVHLHPTTMIANTPITRHFAMQAQC